MLFKTKFIKSQYSHFKIIFEATHLNMGGKFYSYLNTAAFIIETYDDSTPLVHHLKHYFAQFKKHGSKDRKFISHACYCYYRLGTSIVNIPTTEQLKIALFLCNPEPSVWHIIFTEEWLSEWKNTIERRIEFIEQQFNSFNAAGFFPWQEELSNGVDVTQFSLSHLIQPLLFVRLRPSHEKTVVQRLRDVEISFQKIGTNCLALPNSTKLADVVRMNEELVVQDYNSQQIANFITPELIVLNWQQTWKVWDCCTASGGKTILLHDIHRINDYYLTDVRASMQHQLKQRLDAAHIQHWKFVSADLTEQVFPFGDNMLFDFIIADVPCTGSGTWARTPEQIHSFKQAMIGEYASTQKKIVTNVVNSLKEDGYLLYITCSVFKQENEAVAMYIQEQLKMQLIKIELMKGYQLKADTMFAALFKKVTV